jgi:hypothetical protein
MEKMCFSVQQRILAALLVSLAYFILAVPIKPQVDNWPLAILVLLLSSLVAGALELATGAKIRPQQIRWSSPSWWFRSPFWAAFITFGRTLITCAACRCRYCEPYRVHE